MFTPVAILAKQAGAAPVADQFIIATGGNITYDGEYKIHSFTTNGTFTITQVGQGGTNNDIAYLILGAGGGGSGGQAGTRYGAGGASGVIRTGTKSDATATGYSVVVGTGGAGGPLNATGATGGNSSVFGTTATGGAGGQNGGTGGSNADYSGGTGFGLSSGAGAGAGQNGASATTHPGNAKGGDGVASSITGTSVTYGGGGGGGEGGVGGAGGGGNAFPSATAGTDGLGGGGGGEGGGGAGKDGGDGIVILRYKFYDPATFSPTDISGLVAWWDANQGTTLSGTDVQVWADQSGNGYYANANTGREPTLLTSIAAINNKNAVSFYRTGNPALNPYLQIQDAAGFGVGSDKTWVPANINNTRTVIAVGRTTNLTAGTWGAWLTQGGGGRTSVSVNFQQYPDGYINFATDNYANGGYKDTSASYLNNTFYTAMWGWSDWATRSTNAYLRVNGVSKTISDWGSAPLTPTTANPRMSLFVDIGADAAYIAADIAEMIVYDSKLSTEDAVKVEGYLRNKYGHY